MLLSTVIKVLEGYLNHSGDFDVRQDSEGWLGVQIKRTGPDTHAVGVDGSPVTTPNGVIVPGLSRGN
jgi:hypothetical protein